MTYRTTQERRRLNSARKRARTIRRKSVAALGESQFSKASQMPEPEMPADGIDRFRDLITNHEREICLTPEAMEEVRMALYSRCGGHCEGCGFSIEYEGIRGFHLHHIFGKGAGKRCDCSKCIQALCKDALMQDGSIRPGCHTKVHARGVLAGPYTRDEANA